MYPVGYFSQLNIGGCKMVFTGNRYEYANGVITHLDDGREIAYLQIGDDRGYLENQLEKVEYNEDLIDRILDAYDYQ